MGSQPWKAVSRHLRKLMLLAGLAVSLLAAPGLAAQTFDHSELDRLLGSHVDASGLVDYDAFDRSPDFENYLHRLDHADLAALPAAERLAFWINAYNAYTIALINRHDERRSIRNINRTLGLFSGKGPWSEAIVRVGGREYTLDQVEHEIIRERFDEPRIHFALVCAAMGCPPLRREAYTGALLDHQLEDQAREFLLRSPDKNRIDLERQTAYLSPIFRWYGEDFGDSDQALLRYLARFYPAGPERERLLRGDLRIRHTEYDWALNSQAAAASTP